MFPWRPFVLDMNADGKATISDVGLWLEQIFFLPGDWLIWALLAYAPDIGDFFEISTAHYGSSIAALLSVLSWLCITCLFMIAIHYVGEFDRALTGIIVNTWHAIVLKGKMGWNYLRAKFSPPAKAEQVLNLHAGEQLSAKELRVLRVHADADPRAALDIDAVARKTSLSPDEVRHILRRLRELEFVDELGAETGVAAGYAVTAPGKAFLVFRDLSTG